MHPTTDRASITNTPRVGSIDDQLWGISTIANNTVPIGTKTFLTTLIGTRKTTTQNNDR